MSAPLLFAFLILQRVIKRYEMRTIFLSVNLLNWKGLRDKDSQDGGRGGGGGAVVGSVTGWVCEKNARSVFHVVLGQKI
jgi:hypothetical protein